MGNPTLTGGFPHKGPLMRKAFPDHDVTMHFLPLPFVCPSMCGPQLLLSVNLVDTPGKLNPFYPLQWRHNERDGVSNQRRLGCLLNFFFRRRLKKTSKLSVTGLCEGNPPVTGEFPAQRTSNTENVSIWWRHAQVDHYCKFLGIRICIVLAYAAN